MPDGVNGTKRPYSPGRSTVMEKGQQVLFFFESDASDPRAPLVYCGTPKNRGPGGFLFAGSHAWLLGTLEHDFDGQKVDPDRKETWPKVRPKAEYSFVTRKGTAAALATPLQVRWVTTAKSPPCKLSLLFVRWGGEYSKWMDEQEANDGDWGKYGSPPSDEYMGHVVKEGIKAHAGLKDEQGMPLFELHHVFISNSKDAHLIAQQAHIIRAGLKAQRRAAFWMLWPAEWEDFGDPDYACYIERHSMFAAMRACEGLGIRSLFPHPADQYELITSKSWMATLSLHPGQAFWCIETSIEFLDRNEPDLQSPFTIFTVTPGIWLPVILGKQNVNDGLLCGFLHQVTVFCSTPSGVCLIQRQIAASAGAFLPAATLVSKGSVKIDAAKAAETALRTLHHIRRMNPYPVEPGDPPAPSVVNQNGIQKARSDWVETNPGDVFLQWK